MTIPTGVILVVADTNILVSALLTDGPPARIVDLIAEGKIRPCFDDRILAEYWDVLSRPKFGFPSARINRLIHDIVRTGFGITPVVFPLEFLLKIQHRRVLKEKHRVAALDGVCIVVFEVVFSPPPGLDLTVSPPTNFVKIAQLRLEYSPSHASF
jgi:predicted nucleic acid-binding protein